ncbi:hypothetical protein M5C72_01715 [Companilactobacillus allii]|nr:hypothetical protein [Companilactobacillus allii]USQ68976.1 hypothetical protein M5C72_01715 [Companilactobacillus allii]
MIIKAHKQGNSMMITLPSFLKVEEGTSFEPRMLENGTIELVPTTKNPSSMKELFKNWNGKYNPDPEMKDWDNINPSGNEIM